MTAALSAPLRLAGLSVRVVALLVLAAVLGVVLAACGAGAPAPTPLPAASAPAAPTVAVPVRVDVDTIDAHSTLLATGLRPDGTLDVPPVEQPEQASWYRESPRPGLAGPAIVLGHVNGRGRDGVFARLDEIATGARIAITRADGSVAAFEVYRVQMADKAAFPTAEVYGNTAGPELRLITCGGDFDRSARSYEQNVIAYAREVPA